MSSHFASPSVGASSSTSAFRRITRTTLALYAGASGDHNPMHIDIDFAKKAGFPGRVRAGHAGDGDARAGR